MPKAVNVMMRLEQRGGHHAGGDILDGLSRTQRDLSSFGSRHRAQSRSSVPLLETMIIPFSGDSSKSCRDPSQPHQPFKKQPEATLKKPAIALHLACSLEIVMEDLTRVRVLVHISDGGVSSHLSLLRDNPSCSWAGVGFSYIMVPLAGWWLVVIPN